MRQFYRSFVEKMSHLGATGGSPAKQSDHVPKAISWTPCRHSAVLQMFLSIVWCSLVILKNFWQFMLFLP